ncbi:MAG: chorismate mutase [Acidobacteriota bacterium]
MNIEYWRNEIDDLDRELLQLLNRRARLAMKVGTLKKVAGLPCSDPEREHLVLSRLQQANSGPLDHRAITKLFRRIIGESRRIEARMLMGDELSRRPHSGRKPEVTARPLSSQTFGVVH